MKRIAETVAISSLAKTPKRILVIYVTRIGDTMLITPSIRALADAWPEAKIDFIGSPTSAAVLENLPFIAQVSSNKKRCIRFQGWFAARDYDLAVVYGYDGDGPFVRYALRVARAVIAYTQKDATLNLKLAVAVEKPPFGTCHSVDHFLALIAPLGIQARTRRLAYCVADAESAWARTTLNALIASNIPRPLVGLQIASFPTKSFRDWPVQNFLAIACRILAAWPDAHFLILGGTLELDRTRWLTAELGPSATHIAGRFSLRQSAALMNELDLYIGVDTGPTHIFGALGKPMVSIYHGSSPSYLLAPLEHPCLYPVDHPFAGHVGNDASMADVTVDMVWDAVQRAFQSHLLR